MKLAQLRHAALPLLFLILVATTVVLMIVFRDSGGESDGGDAYSSGRGARVHDLDDAPKARFISLFISNNSGIVSLMIGGKTDEFNTITESLKVAKPVSGGEDETFSDLLVIYFGEEDTLEVSYSRSRNLLDWGGTVYQPPADLAPVLKSVEEKTAY